MSKVVVLNSGGFDSIVLMNYVYTVLEEKDIHSLHFLYGASNETQQLRCVDKVCKKLNAHNKVIQLPFINWTQSDFFDSQSKYKKDKQYLEYRNLIFLSYALSYAESIGAKRIYIAFLNHNDYRDTTPEFLDGLNYFSAPGETGIEIIAPFHCNNKYVVGHFAKFLGVTKDDFFSCDKPNSEGSPCGICPDCLALKEIYNNF